MLLALYLSWGISPVAVLRPVFRLLITALWAWHSSHFQSLVISVFIDVKAQCPNYCKKGSLAVHRCAEIIWQVIHLLTWILHISCENIDGNFLCITGFLSSAIGMPFKFCILLLFLWLISVIMCSDAEISVLWDNCHLVREEIRRMIMLFQRTSALRKEIYRQRIIVPTE